MAKRITKVISEIALKFPHESPRSQFYEAATPGVKFEVESPFIWIGWKGEWRGIAASRAHVEGVDGEDRMAAARAAKAAKRVEEAV